MGAPLFDGVDTGHVAPQPTHTPGPWEWQFPVTNELADFDKKKLDTRDWDSGNGHGLDGATRAVLIPWDSEGYEAGIYIRLADARLIAAAPDLLEAAKEAEESVKDALITEELAGREANAQHKRTVLDQLQAAIAKAEKEKE